eukprot:GCRY01005022.1.p1 GENE.GCRY01005022.1~~GCRY01005022.1.p1  ORF type:complete len:313 (+),score=26.39 GCRY01005022.1:76-1014(+)
MWGRLRCLEQCLIEKGHILTLKKKTFSVLDHGIPFLVGVVQQYFAKPKPNLYVTKGDNPFDPPDPSLVIDNFTISQNEDGLQRQRSYNLLFNKFQLEETGLLLTTAQYESQSNPLNQFDFEAIWTVCARLGPHPDLQEFSHAQHMDPPPSALVIFNCGFESGTSQPHKHAQIFPVPLTGMKRAPLPLHSLLQPLLGQKDSPFSLELPFKNRFISLKKCDLEAASPSLMGLFLHSALRTLLSDLQRDLSFHSYNVLLTSQWMGVIPRSAVANDLVITNGLGYAGLLFVKNEDVFVELKQCGIVTTLTSLGFSS